MTMPFFPVRLGVSDGDGAIEVKFARTTVVVQPVGYVTVLLHFHQGESGTNGMDGAGGEIKEITGSGWVPFEQALDAAVQRGGSHRHLVDR